MKKYSTIIFDLFDTIVNFNFNHLPNIELNGFRSRTTSIEVYEVFKKYYPEITFSEFYQPFMDSYHEFQDLKQKEYREFPNSRRFEIMLGKMRLSRIKDKTELENKMVLAHMNALSSCVEFPEENRSILEYVQKEGFKMAIVSNFDYAPTAYDLIDKFQIRNLFEVIIISGDVGWRKPKDIIFRIAIDNLAIEADEALFVGDNYKADVIGSKCVGMDAVWINRRNETDERLEVKPDFIIKKFYELRNIV